MGFNSAFKGLIRSNSFLLRSNNKQNFEVDSAASSGGQGKHFLWPPPKAALSNSNSSLFFCLKQVFWLANNKSKAGCRQGRNISLLKTSTLKDSFFSSVDRDLAKKCRRGWTDIDTRQG